MKHHHFSNGQEPAPSPALLPDAAADPDPTTGDFAPSADEVARRAYFAYVNQGSLSGHEVQHWLAAEAELIAERNRTRIHGFHNRT